MAGLFVQKAVEGQYIYLQDSGVRSSRFVITTILYLNYN